MLTKITFHEVHSLGLSIDRDRAISPLPFEVMKNVTIEDVSTMLTDETLKWVSPQIGIYQTEALKNVRFALVHRYAAQSEIRGTDEDVASEKLVRNLIELVHIVRPMRQKTSIVHAESNEAGLSVTGFDTPDELEVPEVQKLFYLRDKDLHLLKEVTPLFLHAMGSGAMKFRASAFYHSVGRSLGQGNAKYLLWCSAIEALYTSHGSEHQGKLVATERIKWFLGAREPIYGADDIPDFVPQSTLTIADVVDALYIVRNYMAHGDIIPSEYFNPNFRQGIAGGVATIEVLGEAASFIIRKSLLRILRDGLLHHFENAERSNAYFAAEGLTKSVLKRKSTKSS